MIEWLGSPARPGTLGQVSPDVLFSIQAFLNDALQQFSRPQIRTDGVLDQATCEALFSWSRGELGALDPTLQQLVEDNIAELQPACSALATGTTPPPPLPEPVPANPFEQCVVGFGDVSDAVRSVQRRINGELAERGYVAIPEDGSWNSVTCGALYFLTLTQGVPAEGEGSPFDIPECPGGMTVPTTCPDRVTPTKAGAPAARAGISPLAIGLIAAVIIGGAYAVTQS